jgi:general secretion pathway protein L
LTDPEENHVVPGAILKHGQRTLFIVDKQWLQSILAACNFANINLRQAVPEMLLPVLPSDSWVIVWEGDKGFMRTGQTSGMALDHGDAQQPPTAFTLSLSASLPLPPQNIQFRFPSGTTQLNPPSWPNLPASNILGKGWDWRTEPIPNDTLNLLWGSLAPKTRLLEWLPKLRPVALIFLAAIFIETLGTNIEWGLLNHQKNILTKEMERTFLKTFGETSVVVNPPLQMQRNIAKLRHTAGLADDADFLSLLDQASSSLAKLPTGSVTALHYESGKLDVDLKLRNDAEILNLQQRLQSKGLGIRLSDIRKTGSGVETRLAILNGGIQ